MPRFQNPQYLGKGCKFLCFVFFSLIVIFLSSYPYSLCTVAILSGGRWKEIRHDNTVTWLAFWNDPINPKEFKYVFLAASSSLKGQSDKEKYEKSRKLKVLDETSFVYHFQHNDLIPINFLQI